MCGFVVMLHHDAERPVTADTLRPATAALVHRGPDDEGIWTDGPLGMGFRRLAILDLSAAGHQPMHSADGRYTIVFNGEVYNFVELRRELEAAGDTFVSDSDTEVVLAAFRRWGHNCFARFNGMWALCIWDRTERTLTASRDRFGIKPLYIGRRNDRWLLGSELQALTSIDPQPPRLCAVHAADFLDHGLLDHDDTTVLQGFWRVPPGHVATLRPGDSAETLHTYYSLADASDPDRTARIAADPDGREARALIDEFRATFVDAVRLRLRADVPVGTCLSGGLDSGGIVCATAEVAAEARGQNSRHAFSAMMAEFDESEYIQAVIAQTGVRLTSVRLDEATLLQGAELLLQRHDEPVHSLTPLAGMLVFQAAQEHGVTVLLNGQGADELLAGYPSYVPYYVRAIARELGVIEAFSQWRAEGIRGADALSVLRQFGGRRADRAWRRLKASRQGQSLLASDLQSAVRGERWMDRNSLTSGLQSCLDRSVTSFPLPLYLRIEDRNAMAYSREARLPYLDPRVVQLSRTAPACMKRRAGLNKWLQREAFVGLLPEVVRTRRDKMGFPVPGGRWLRGPLRPLLLDTVARGRLQQRGIYDVDAVIAQRDRFLASDSLTPPGDLYRVFLYEAWARRHVDRRVER